MPSKVGKHRDQSLRALHLLDLENLVGGRVTPDTVRAAWQRYLAVVRVHRDDSVVVGVANRHAETAVFSLPAKVRWVIGANVADGADVALAAAVDVQHAAMRYGRVYLASCDHYFARMALEFRALGRPVTQVIGDSHVSAELYLACQADVRLPLTLAA